jgi:hypothetical protein
MTSLNTFGLQIQGENKFLAIVKQVYKIGFLETLS